MTRADDRAVIIAARIEAGERRADIANDLGISAERVSQIVRKPRRQDPEAEPTDRERKSDRFPRTPDGRYVVVRGRLWRLANPGLSEERRARFVRELMAARRTISAATKRDDIDAEHGARAIVDLMKRALGERGPVWWTDGSPDLNRHMIHTSPYADWYARLEAEPSKRPD